MKIVISLHKNKPLANKSESSFVDREDLLDDVLKSLKVLTGSRLNKILVQWKKWFDPKGLRGDIGDIPLTGKHVYNYITQAYDTDEKQFLEFLESVGLVDTGY